jgi:hypothetical protein
MKVGLCWVGSKSHKNDAMRSLPKESLIPLAAVEGVEWVSLARDAWTPELGRLGLPNGLEGCEDWLDTAHAIQGLDLVVTVDTAIAHLAGGVGVPTWILIAAVPDFRWMLDRSDTPLYRSVRLYRQTIAGQWGPVVERVAADLALEVQARRMIA